MKRKLFFSIILVLIFSFITVGETGKNSLIFKALELGKQGDFKNTKTILLKILSENFLHIRAKRVLDVINDYNKGIVGRFAAKIIFEGFESYYRNNWDKAIELFSKAKDLNPGYYLAHHNLGAGFYQNGQSLKAIKELEEALKLNSRYTYTHNNLGLAFHSIGNPYKAIKYYRKAILLDKNYYKA